MEGRFITNEVRSPEGLWINSQVFREEAIHFEKNGYYCPDRPGTTAYMEYWTEQLRRCQEGYTSGGVSITGHHYNYLNFTPIQKVVEIKKGVGKKIVGMPDFWDGDYNFFWALEISRTGMSIENYKALQLGMLIEEDWLNGGHHTIVGKARRKGYSFKNASICANTYNTVRKSLSIIGAFDKKYLYPTGTMGMVSEYLSFYNKHTAWAKAREKVDKQEHKRASFEENRGGIPVEAGYMSDIMAVTFKDNPEAARGKDARIVLLEEAGAFPNLIAAYNATAPGLSAGVYTTGQIIIFGTGGDMEYGTTDFADMFYHPKRHNILPFVNIWDEEARNSSCGFFHPVSWNMEGFYDEQGNSDEEGARNRELGVRKEIVKNSTSSATIQAHVQEWPLNPAEAFLMTSSNNFPIMELRAQYNKVLRENLHTRYGQPVNLFVDPETKKVTAIPDLEGKLSPIWDHRPKTDNIAGCPVIFEYPQPDAPRGLYKIGFDPYRHDTADSSMSLAAIYVYKGTSRFSFSRNTIVASFIGRPYSADAVNRIAELLAELYNAEIMYENEVTHVRDYFIRKKKIGLLALQPNTVISKVVTNSKVARVYGIHMNDKIKDAGEKYIKEWLLEERDFDENGDVIRNIDLIYDLGLLEELISYNKKGNFDRVMALMMLMFQIAEEEEGKVYGDKKNPKVQSLMAMMEKQFKKSTTF